MRCRVGLAVTLGVLSAATGASAQSPSGEPSPGEPEATQGLEADAWVGVGTSSLVHGNRNSFLAAGGLTGLYHLDSLEVGGAVTGQTLWFDATAHAVIASGLVGMRFEPSPRMRVEVLSEWGVDEIQIDPGLFESGSGGTAALPYVGARVGMTLRSRGRLRFVVGWWAAAGDALGSATVRSTFEDCFFWCDSVSQTNTVGGFGWAVSGRVGIESADW